MNLLLLRLYFIVLSPRASVSLRFVRPQAERTYIFAVGGKARASTMSKAFGSHLRNLRKKNTKLSQLEMANMLNISRSTYTYYETGKSEPGQEKLRKICKILNVDFNTLLRYDSQPDVEAVASERNSEETQKTIKTLSASEEQLVAAYRNMNSEEKEFISMQIAKMLKG